MPSAATAVGFDADAEADAAVATYYIVNAQTTMYIHAHTAHVSQSVAWCGAIILIKIYTTTYGEFTHTHYILLHFPIVTVHSPHTHTHTLDIFIL